MAVDLTRLSADVTVITTAVGKLITLAERLVAENKNLAEALRILQSGTDDVAMQAGLDALATQLEISSAAAADEITAATPTSSA